MFYIMKRLQLRKTVVLDIMYYFGIIMILYAIDIVKVLKEVGIWMNMDMMKFIHFGAHCSNCGCNYSRYRFKNFYTTKEKVKKNKKEKTYRTDANAQQKESKKKIKDKLNKDINEKKLKINILKSKINKSLKEGFEYIYQLAMNNKELNADVLSEDKEKYGYSKQILKENMEKKIIKILLIYLL